jgi:hypothetical protein
MQSRAGRVQDRRSGEWYDPAEKFDQLKNSPEFQSQMQRMARREGMAEGWKDEADDFTEWSNHVKEKLSKASPEQRLGLAKQLSQLEVKHFGSTVPNTFNRQTGKPQAGLGLTDTVRNALKYFNAEQTGIRQQSNQDGAPGNFSMPFGSVDIQGLENATPEELAVMKQAVMMGPDVAGAATRFYKKHGTITRQDLSRIQQELAAAASDEWEQQHGVREGIERAVDANGRTQSQWIQLVKAKFPNGKLIQSKMPDGPVQVTLPDGRKLSWSKVEQAVAESSNPYGYEVGQTVKLHNGKNGQVLDVFDDSIEVLLPDGRTVTVDFRDAEVLDEASGCNHTQEGEMCPEHGLTECGMHESQVQESQEGNALLARIKSLALLR